MKGGGPQNGHQALYITSHQPTRGEKFGLLTYFLSII